MYLSRLLTFLALAILSITTLAAPTNDLPENMSPASEDPDPTDPGLLGLNCNGSGMCAGGCIPASIKWLLNEMSAVPDDVKYQNGKQVVCRKCVSNGDGAAVCVFPQHMKNGETVTAGVVKEKLARLIRHGCKKCGSCPIHPGNNSNTGEITVNYTTKSCGPGVCPHGQD